MKDWIILKFQEFLNFLIDALLFVPVHAFDGLLKGLAYIINKIPAPDFMTNYSMNNYIPEEIVWLLYQSRFDDCLLIISGGIAFYFARRVLTLGIW